MKAQWSGDDDGRLAVLSSDDDDDDDVLRNTKLVAKQAEIIAELCLHGYEKRDTRSARKLTFVPSMMGRVLLSD